MLMAGPAQKNDTMNTRFLLGATAWTLGAAGFCTLLLPQEVLGLFDVGPTAPVPVLMQLLAAALFAFAMVNWTARGTTVGGIYGRPIAIGNMTHFFVGGMALLSAVLSGRTDPVMLVLLLVYGGFAVAFAMVLFRSPV